MPSVDRIRSSRFGRVLVAVSLLALVIVPAAAALRFTDDSYKTPRGAVGSYYAHQFKGDGGCGPALPYQFRILSGALPPGLSLAKSGLVSGTPTQTGSWSFWVELSDEDPPSQSWCRPTKSQREFTIEIGPPGSAPPAAQPSSGGGGFSVPNPCNLPVVGNVCDAVAGAVTKVAAEAGEFVMRGVTAWVTNAAVWVTGKLGALVEKTSSPDLTASWFQGQYATMLAISGALALLLLMLAVIQSLMRQDVGLLVRCAFGYLPMAFILAGAAVAATGLLIAITDDISAAIVSSLGTEQSDNLLQTVGDAYKGALDDSSGIPLFGVFLGALILALGAFVLLLEMIIRDAAIYICVFFLPLTFVAMIWPATSRWARRLVELLVAIVLAKFVIVAILSLASAAITNTGVVDGEGQTFEQMLAGSALLLLAAWSPFALLRMLPMMELAAANVTSHRASIAAATGAAGIQTPAAYIRQAMDRRSPSSSPPRSQPTSGPAAHPRSAKGERPAEQVTAERTERDSTAVHGAPSESGGGAIDPEIRRAAPDSPPAERSRPTESPPAPPPTRRPRPPEPPPDRRPPPDRGEE